jgi:hypothetical protein
MNKILPSPTLPESPNDTWWNFSTTTWLLVGGLVLLNVGCFLSPSILDTVLSGVFHTLDFRTWAWWYFLEIIIVLAFAMRWFLLYQTYVNDDFDPQSSEEAKWFCILSGTITFIFAVLAFLHRFFRFFLLYYAYYPLYSWFRLGHGAFSLTALLIFIISLATLGLLIALVWKWLTTLQTD